MFQCKNPSGTNNNKNSPVTDSLLLNIKTKSLSTSLASTISNLGPLVSLVSNVLAGSSNSSCVSRIRICDGVNDCADKSDESFCQADCGEHSFKCKSTGRCIPSSW